jgi:hypothetical protein
VSVETTLTKACGFTPVEAVAEAAVPALLLGEAAARELVAAEVTVSCADASVVVGATVGVG